ncbi:hypothetical protein FRB95_006834 [Tulasnella sp. JGI-2019a]|nr:hypothetical protein FRB95_006834 [Tulasnella sp. JGI-2019a]
MLQHTNSKNDDVTPFKIHVHNDDLADLQIRLALTRYPQELNLPADAKWSYGIPVNIVKELVEYWKTEFDWRKAESALNAKLPQYTTVIDTGTSEHGSLNIHFAHRRSSRLDAIPLLFVHGWPGNFSEISKIAEALTEPNDGNQCAFHIISPSLPGFGFSDAPKAPGFNLRRIADVFDKLMKKLGYSRYVAQGGDWGSMIIRGMALWHHDSCGGILNNMMIAHPTLVIRHPIMAAKLVLGYFGIPGGYSKAEIGGLISTNDFTNNASAYRAIQEQTPQTLAFSMTDSPAGLLAWLAEKYMLWSPDYKWNKDEILTWTMLYWIAGPAPTFRLYKEHNPGVYDDDSWKIMTAWSSVPLGVATFKDDIIQFPDDFGSMVQPLKYVKRHDCGGHYAAWEHPDFLVHDIQEFTKIVVANDPSFLGSSLPATATPS